MASQPVFVVSTGRAGSKMLAHVLSLHPNLCTFHEPRPYLNAEAYGRWADIHDASSIRRKIQDKRQIISQVERNGLIYVESSHFTSHLIPELQHLFDARFVHLFRDGRDFVCSGLERKTWYNGLSLKNRLKEQLRRWTLWDIGSSKTDHRLDPPRECNSRFEKVCWLWNEINEVILRSLEAVPEDRKMSLALEELNVQWIVSLLDFIGVEVSQPLLQDMVEIAVRKPNKTRQRSVSLPENWTVEQERQFDKWAGEMMRRLNYNTTT